MFEKFSRSWSLIKASASVLQSDKELLLFPIISSIATILVSATFILPLALSGWMGELVEGENPILYLVGFAFYLTQYFVIIYFNSALIGAALIRLRGGDPTVADGFRIANSKLGVIFGYAVIAATVGIILRAIEQRAGWIGQIVIGMIGLAWTFATFLAVPVLVSQNVGPIDAVKNSALLLKKTWGENLLGNVGMGLVFGILIVLAIVLGIGLTIAAASTGSAALAIAVGAIAAIGVILLVLIQAALQGIYAAAVYRFAAEGDAGGQFDSAMLSSAFKAKM